MLSHKYEDSQKNMQSTAELCAVKASRTSSRLLFSAILIAHGIRGLVYKNMQEAGEFPSSKSGAAISRAIRQLVSLLPPLLICTSVSPHHYTAQRWCSTAGAGSFLL